MKKLIYLTLSLLLLSACTITPDQVEQEQNSQATPPPTNLVQQTNTSSPEAAELNRIDLQKDLCSQISFDFVTQATGITIARTKKINDVQINACDYYLTNESNSPYIAVVVNKNLSVAKQKEIAQKKYVLKTDQSISGDHYVVWADNESRIVNINLILDDNNFIRIDKNVQRAIDNNGMINLAAALSKKYKI